MRLRSVVDWYRETRMEPCIPVTHLILELWRYADSQYSFQLLSSGRAPDQEGSRLYRASLDLMLRLDGSIPLQSVRRLFCDCDHSGVGIAAHDRGHHGRIDYTQPFSAENP